jgi:hypothetical protein
VNGASAKRNFNRRFERFLQNGLNGVLKGRGLSRRGGRNPEEEAIREKEVLKECDPVNGRVSSGLSKE